jgi:hypothetical protein
VLQTVTDSGNNKRACHCRPSIPALVDSICQQVEAYHSNLFFTLFVRPYVSGEEGDGYLSLVDQIATELVPLEKRMKYSVPGQSDVSCLTSENGTDHMQEVAQYFGNLKHVDRKELDNIFEKINRIVEESKQKGVFLCDYKYPVKCMGGTSCELIDEHDYFVQEDKTKDHGVIIWDIGLANGSPCGDNYDWNKNIPKIYKCVEQPN